jgi:hypothetical protein
MAVTKIDSSNISSSGVTAGSYTTANITVNEQGIITSASSGNNVNLATTSIDALSDVDTTTTAPNNGQGLVWDSTANKWKPGNVTAAGGGSGTRTVTTITATSNQTVFTVSGGYTVGYVDVYQNGVKLVDTEDYTATNTTSVTLVEGAGSGDIVEIVAYQIGGIVSTAGAKAGGAIIVNTTTITENYTFPSGHNGFSIGPVLINSGVVVNQNSNQRWVVL